jgi:hypothetical protein
VPFDDSQRRTLAAALDLVLPGDDSTPGAGAAGGGHYVEQLLDAFEWDPPRIWAGGPFSGRHGGEARFDRWLELGPWEATAWRQRIAGWRSTYEEGLALLGVDFADLPVDEQHARVDRSDEEFRELLYTHASESLYGDPVYGGNRDAAGWRAIEFRGDVQPRGYTDGEVMAP